MMRTAEITDRLTQGLKTLHLPTMRTGFAEVADLARREGFSFERYLLELVEQECEVRQQNRVVRLLRQSKLPLEKTIETFDRNRLPGPVQAQVSVLLEGGFLRRTENILAFGNPGSGKTHLVCAIGTTLLWTATVVHAWRAWRRQRLPGPAAVRHRRRPPEHRRVNSAT